MPAAFHVVDDGGAGVAVQHVAREQHQLAVGPDDLAGLRDHAQPVAVAVEGQAQLTVGIGHAVDQVAQVLGFGRIGMVIGKGAVHLAEQLGHFAAECAEQLRRHGASHAIAAVDGDLHGAGEFHAAGHACDIGLHQVQLPARARMRGDGRRAAVHDAREFLHVLAIQGAAAHHHLEAVVLGRVVAAGDGHARTGLHGVRGEIHQRRGHLADIERIDALFQHAFLQRRRQHFAAEPAVATHDQRLDAGLAGAYRQRRAQRAGEAGVDQVGHGAADVVGLEYRSGEWRGGAHAGSFGGGKA